MTQFLRIATHHRAASGAVPTVASVSPTGGPTGTTVTITGTNFENVTAVKFGPTAATSFTVETPTQIKAVSPVVSGAIDVRVTTTVGTSAAGPNDKFTGAPTITSVSPNAGPSNTNVTIMGTNFINVVVGGVKFGANNAVSFNVISANEIQAVAPSFTGTVDIRVTTPVGTSATSVNDQFTETEVTSGVLFGAGVLKQGGLGLGSQELGSATPYFTAAPFFGDIIDVGIGSDVAIYLRAGATPAGNTVWTVGHNAASGHLGLGYSWRPQPGGGPYWQEQEHELIPKQVTGGIQLFQAENHATVIPRMPGARNYRPTGPLGDLITTGSAHPIAVRANDSRCFVLRSDGVALGWGANGKGALANGIQGNVEIEQYKHPGVAFEDEEADHFLPQFSPRIAMTAWNSELAEKESSNWMAGFKFGGTAHVNFWKEGAVGNVILGPASGKVKLKPQTVNTKVLATVKATFTAGSKIVTVATLAEAEKVKTGQLVVGEYVMGGTTVAVQPAAGALTFEMSSAALFGETEAITLESVTITLKAKEPLPFTLVATGNLELEPEEPNVIFGGPMIIYVRQGENSVTKQKGGFSITLPGVKWGSEGPPPINAEAGAVGGGTINTGYEALTVIMLYGDSSGWYGGRWKQLTDVVDVQIGHEATLFLKGDGSIWRSGELAGYQETCLAQPVTGTSGFAGPSGGLGSAPRSPKPVEIRTGSEAAIARMSDGTARTFGHNKYGQLGNGASGGNALGVATPSIPEPVINVGAAEGHAGAVTAGGKVFMWGHNQRGQCGDGTTVLKATPTQVPANLPNPATNPVVEIECGDELFGQVGTNFQPCTIALIGGTGSEAGTIRTWGGNHFEGAEKQGGGLGDLTLQDKLLPVKPPLPSGVTGKAIKVFNNSGSATMFLAQGAVLPKPQIETIPEPGGKLRIRFRKLGAQYSPPVVAPGEVSPAESYRLKYQRKSLLPLATTKPTYIEKEWWNPESNQEPLISSPVIPGGAGTYTDNQSPPNPYTTDGNTYDYVIALSELIPRWSSATDQLTVSLIENTPTQLILEPAAKATKTGEEPGNIYLYTASWPLTPEAGWIVRWRHSEKYTRTIDGKLLYEEWVDGEELPGNATSFAFALVPRKVAGTAETGGNFLKGEGVEVQIKGAFLGAFQTRIVEDFPGA